MKLVAKDWLLDKQTPAITEMGNDVFELEWKKLGRARIRFINGDLYWSALRAFDQDQGFYTHLCGIVPVFCRANDISKIRALAAGGVAREIFLESGFVPENERYVVVEIGEEDSRLEEYYRWKLEKGKKPKWRANAD